MQEWIIAMLVISVLLVLRDMAKVFFRGRSFLKAEQPAEEKNPQKEKVERYAASFRKLADSFYGLPYRKDYLSNGQVDGIIRETCDEICSHCYQREICWGTQSQEMYRGSERMIRSMEEGNQEKIQETKSAPAETAGKTESASRTALLATLSSHISQLVRLTESLARTPVIEERWL